MTRDKAAGLLLFVAVSAALAGLLVPGAFLRGEVLSQATLLYGYQPWSAHAPAGVHAPNPLLTDPAIVFYPFLTHAAAALREGRLPLWSASLYAGHPFLASFQSAVFSPFTALAAVVPLPQATVPIALAPLVVGAAGMFLYVRGLGLHAYAAWLAGVAFLLNAFSVGWMEHPLTPVTCWVPWLLRASDRLTARPTAARAAALALFVALVILAGHPETAVKVLLVAGLYTLVGVRRAGGALALPAAAGVAGGLLAAVQLVPFAEYLMHSEAFAAREALPVNRFYLPAGTMIAALVPDFLGNPAEGPYAVLRNRHGGEANYAEQAVYAGMPVLVLAVAAIASAWHEPRVRFFTAAGAGSLALMYGAPGLLGIVSSLPIARVMILSRFGLIVIVSLVVLAAYGIDRLTGSGGPAAMPRRVTRAVVVLIALATAGIGAAALGLRETLAAHGLTGAAFGGSVAAAGLLGASAALVLLRVHGRLAPRGFAAAVVALAAVDLLAAGQGFHPTAPPQQIYPPLPELARLRQDPGLFRVYGWRDAFIQNAAMAYGLHDIRGWDGVNPGRYTRLLDLGYLRQHADPDRHLRDPKLLDLLNVKYVFTDPGLVLPAPRFRQVSSGATSIYENTQALPRTFLVDRYLARSDADIARALHDGTVDPGGVALLEQQLPPSAAPEPRGDAGAGTAHIRRYEDTLVEIDVDTPVRQLLVLSDAFYPGWRATVDGDSAPIYRAYYALRAVTVPAGRHTVRFTYAPSSLRAGALVSAATLALGSAVVLMAMRRRPV